MNKIIFHLFLIFCLSLSMVSSIVIAAEEEGAIGNTNSGDNGTNNQSCDLRPFRDSLAKTESQGSGDYLAANSIKATGRYQFMPTTADEMSAYINAPAQCKTMGVYGSGLATEACAGVQDAMMDELTLRNLKTLQNCPEAVAAVGTRTVGGYKIVNGVKDYNWVHPNTGTSVGPCTVSWSGLLASAHLGGAGGTCSTLRTGNDVDDGSMSRLGYLCIHRDLPVPSVDCNPQQYPTPEGGTTQTAPIEPWDGYAPPAGTIMDANESLKLLWVNTLQRMTTALVTNMMQQVQILGTFFDAKHQLETQRLLQEKTALAHKKYHPSEQMCEIGTFVRSLGESERRAVVTQSALVKSMIDRAMKSADASTRTISSDEDTVENNYLSYFCSPSDNAGQNAAICTADINAENVNADINYTRSVSMPLTLDIDLLDDPTNPVTSDELTVFALLDNLFMHNTFPQVSMATTKTSSFVEVYMEMRSLMALRSVAQNSLSFIIAQKAAGSDSANNVAPFLKSMMQEMGITEYDIEEMLGENPSYYAQMEMLTRQIYYHPDFISNLYDKPANVKRMAAAMTAIKSMQNWQISEALKRREMLFSVLTEIQLREAQSDLETKDIPTLLNGRPDVGP